jgi:raffinose/stachyose/melibiose transport system substrate-binding protein
MWTNFGGSYLSDVTKALVNKYEHEHPHVHVEVTTQPASNYFSLLQSAGVSRKGPDLISMWSGLYGIQHGKYLENLKSDIDSSKLKNINQLKWVSKGIDASKGPYMIPVQTQYYGGYYNKKLFKRAHIHTVPRTWKQLYSACRKLKQAGVPQCIYYGSGSTGQTSSGAFYPWYDMSYLAAGVIKPDDINRLYNGKHPWNEKDIIMQLKRWHKLYSDGFTNKDVKSASDVMKKFKSSKAAIIIKGNWVVPELEKALGKNLGVLRPPFTDNPHQKAATLFAGDGIGMTTYSHHKAKAANFLKFLASKQASTIEAKQGLVPARDDVKPSGAANRDWLRLVKDGNEYPILDNTLQQKVIDTGTHLLPATLAGDKSAKATADALKKSWSSLPAADKRTYGSYHG